MGSPAEDLEKVPAAGGAADPVVSWDPAETDSLIDDYMNGRWLQPWTPRGSAQQNRPMVQEVTKDGFRRTWVAEYLSPDQVEAIADEVRAYRDGLMAKAPDPSVRVYTFQHYLNQTLQERVTAIRLLRRQVEDAQPQGAVAAPPVADLAPPEPDLEGPPPVPFNPHATGAQWYRRTDGAPVTIAEVRMVRVGKGERQRFVMSDDPKQLLDVLQITTRYSLTPLESTGS
ncbi:hypothetical protein [Deinococcus multiflagellatus]|uniref:Uncharacterized protein n=2 Tax=Deinococcus multiflagellatus TaxID=1656887 RepID=A0ABW1ZRF8_9DEIO